jgi:outer membrane lipoprotein SlyB
MAQQIINIGTSANKGNGDPIRTAFDKVNKNFTEVYSDIQDIQNGVITLTGSVVGDVKGSLFGDDSTIAFDAITGEIRAVVNNSSVTTTSLVATTVVGDVTGNVTGDVTGNVVGNLTGNVIGNLTGDVVGSVFADDSTLLVDGVNATIPGYIKLSVLKTEVAASADFADFQARIAAL